MAVTRISAFLKKSQSESARKAALSHPENLDELISEVETMIILVKDKIKSAGAHCITLDWYFVDEIRLHVRGSIMHHGHLKALTFPVIDTFPTDPKKHMEAVRFDILRHITEMLDPPPTDLQRSVDEWIMVGPVSTNLNSAGDIASEYESDGSGWDMPDTE